jgi:hypothetical protein
MSRSENSGAICLVSDLEDTDDEFNPHNIFREELESDGASDDSTFILKGGSSSWVGKACEAFTALLAGTIGKSMSIEVVLGTKGNETGFIFA